MTVGFEPAGVLTIVVFVGVPVGKVVSSVGVPGVTVGGVIGGGAGVPVGGGGVGTGVGAKSTRLRNSLGCPNQNLSTIVENRSTQNLTFSVHCDGIAPCLIRQQLGA